MTPVCRFAPSPTGLLHIGGARTGLFNWAFARHGGGTFLLRIEDTDRGRSTMAYENAILDSMTWLRLEPDAAPVRQSERGELYRSKAEILLASGKAYRCYATPAELSELRAAQEARGEKTRYDRRWRERTDHPPNQPYCIRFATTLEGETRIDDLIRGEVTMGNGELDDLVILRADGTATYNFAAAVDDMDAGVTHVIRGEDHITNTIRQIHIHQALHGSLPEFAHLPLILGRKLDENGAPQFTASGEAAYERLSKRNQAVAVEHYREAGYTPEGLGNYLAQLGWTQPGNEIYSLDELAAAFDIRKVHRSAAKFDLERLRWVNQQHMRLMKPRQLVQLAGVEAPDQALELACEKARTVVELQEELSWLQAPHGIAKDLGGQLREDNLPGFKKLCDQLPELAEFSSSSIKELINACCKEFSLRFPRLGMPLRVALTGKEKSPDIARVAFLLGKEEVSRRLAVWKKHSHPSAD